MLRKWFYIASVVALAVVFLAADAGQGRERRGGRGRNRGYNYDNYGSYYRQGDYYQRPADMDQGVRRAYYYSPEAGATPGQEMPVYLDVITLPNAEILIEGQKTMQTGPRRLFYSPPLTPDRNFIYEIQVKTLENGREVTRTRKVDVHAGERVTVDLTRSLPTDRQ
jgi:uncharacterized protein (TIGR03000 family)